MSRRNAILLTLVLSVGYWFAGLFLGGLVIVLFGDCPADPRPNGPATCFAEQRVIVYTAFALIAGGNVPFGWWMYRVLRSGA